jgi:hypothetical protein
MHNTLIQRMLEQVAVYWAPAGKTDQGRQNFAPPVEVACRWDEVTVEFLDPKTNTMTLSKAKVYVGSAVKMVGVLWLSTARKNDGAGTALAQLISDIDPYAQTGAYQIRRADNFPNRRADNTLRTVYL